MSITYTDFTRSCQNISIFFIFVVQWDPGDIFFSSMHPHNNSKVYLQKHLSDFFTICLPIGEQTRIGGGGQSSRFGWSCMSLADLSGPKKFLSMSSQNVCLSENVENLFLCVLFLS